MKSEGLLKAATEVLQQTVADLTKERDTDRRTMTALMHELEQIALRMDEIVPKLADVNNALSSAETGRMLKTPQMAARLAIDEDTLRRMAAQGEVPAVQLVGLGDWRFDPAEVQKSLKAKGAATREARQRAVADPWARGAEDYDTYRDRVSEREGAEQIAKEMEQGL